MFANVVATLQKFYRTCRSASLKPGLESTWALTEEDVACLYVLGVIPIILVINTIPSLPLSKMKCIQQHNRLLIKGRWQISELQEILSQVLIQRNRNLAAYLVTVSKLMSKCSTNIRYVLVYNLYMLLKAFIFWSIIEITVKLLPHYYQEYIISLLLPIRLPVLYTNVCYTFIVHIYTHVTELLVE